MDEKAEEQAFAVMTFKSPRLPNSELALMSALDEVVCKFENIEAVGEDEIHRAVNWLAQRWWLSDG